MIAKSMYSEVISDVVLLMEKQVTGTSRKEIVDFLEELNTSDDPTLSVIKKKKKGRLLFKDLNNHTIRMIDDKSFSELRNRLERKAS